MSFLGADPCRSKEQCVGWESRSDKSICIRGRVTSQQCGHLPNWFGYLINLPHITPPKVSYFIFGQLTLYAAENLFYWHLLKYYSIYSLTHNIYRKLYCMAACCQPVVLIIWPLPTCQISLKSKIFFCGRMNVHTNGDIWDPFYEVDSEEST